MFGQPEFSGKQKICPLSTPPLFETEQQNQEVFLPLMHRPGEAQVDFGEAVVRLGGQLRVAKFFLMDLPYGDAFFVMAFERECTETFKEGHVQAFPRLQ
jgi:transposase